MRRTGRNATTRPYFSPAMKTSSRSRASSNTASTGPLWPHCSSRSRTWKTRCIGRRKGFFARCRPHAAGSDPGQWPARFEESLARVLQERLQASGLGVLVERVRRGRRPSAARGGARLSRRLVGRVRRGAKPEPGPCRRRPAPLVGTCRRQGHPRRRQNAGRPPG